jgi:Tfp pilus assembly protein PilN
MYDINFFAINVKKHRQSNQRRWFMMALYGVSIFAMVTLYILVRTNISNTEDEIVQLDRMIETAQAMEVDFLSETDIANAKALNTSILDVSTRLNTYYLINANVLKDTRLSIGDDITLDEYRLNGKNVYMQARTTDETELFIFQSDLESSDYYQNVQVDNISRTDLGEYVANINCELEGVDDETE